MDTEEEQHRDQRRDTGITVWVEEEYGYRYWRWETGLGEEELTQFWESTIHSSRDWRCTWCHCMLPGRLIALDESAWTEEVMVLPTEQEVAPTSRDRQELAHKWAQRMDIRLSDVPDSSDHMRWALMMERVEMGHPREGLDRAWIGYYSDLDDGPDVGLDLNSSSTKK